VIDEGGAPSSPSLYCAVCKKKFNTEATMNQHLASSKHLKAEAKAKKPRLPGASPSPSPAPSLSPAPATPGYADGPSASVSLDTAARSLEEADAAANPTQRAAHLTTAARAFATAGRVREAYTTLAAACFEGETDTELRQILLARLAFDGAPLLALRHFRVAHLSLGVDNLMRLVHGGQRSSAFDLAMGAVGRAREEHALRTPSRVTAAPIPSQVGLLHTSALMEHAAAVCATVGLEGGGSLGEAISVYLMAAAAATGGQEEGDFGITGRDGDGVQCAAAWKALGVVAEKGGLLAWGLDAKRHQAQALLATDTSQVAVVVCRNAAIGAAFLGALRLQDPVWCARMAPLAQQAEGISPPLPERLLRMGEVVTLIGNGTTSGAQELHATIQREHPEDAEVRSIVCPALEALLLRPGAVGAR